MRAASGAENFSRSAARRSYRPKQDGPNDEDAHEFDVCGHCAVCIQPDSPAQLTVKRDIRFWLRDLGVNSRSFFVDALDVVRSCSRLRLSLSAIFRRPERGKPFLLCAQ